VTRIVAEAHERWYLKKISLLALMIEDLRYYVSGIIFLATLCLLIEIEVSFFSKICNQKEHVLYLAFNL
jgi:hypothetical protein